MKKNSLLFILLLILSLNLISCTNLKNSNNENMNTAETKPKEEIQEPEPIKEFKALGKNYTFSKDLSQIEIGTNIYDDQQSIHYTSGEYKEIDFINDLLYLYLNEDSLVYDYLISYNPSIDKGYTSITEADKSKLIKDLNSLRTQMELSEGEEMVVRLDRVTYEGKDSKTNSGETFKIRVAISRVGATVVPWNYFTITVFQDGNNLLAHLF
ncbi:MAG: hypothetical protein HUJ77_12665 [Clostridium sp.]|uniref:hypothetical protein n=1 Tax=Clostridium sp. TaxID=1506 RepID=UPI0025BC2BF9|nr:hypothetical protein [Clostridium sp.]MCF0149235.1 hypothetical protein [Clostridium sp.]